MQALRKRRPQLEVVEHRLTLSGNPVLVSDIVPGPESSHPAEFTELGTGAYFVADSPVHGRELFRIRDGHAELLEDIRPGVDGSQPKSLTEMGGELFFSASRNNLEGTELWKSNGTSSGTVLVKDINLETGGCNDVLCPIVNLTTTGSKPRHFVVGDDVLFFLAFDGPDSGFQMWQSDGTSAGTTRITEGLRGFENITGMGDHLLFKAHDGTGWEHRGFHAPSQTLSVLTDITSSFGPGPIVVGDSHAYFRVEHPIPNGLRIELHRTDGTAAGTGLFFEPASNVLGPLYATNAGDVFVMNWTGGNGFQLARIDASGTLEQVGDGLSSTHDWLEVDDAVYLSAHSAVFGEELWRIDNDGVAELVADVAEAVASSSPRDTTVLGDHLYFTADDGIHGRELWMTDGTPEGTRLVADIRPGPQGSEPTGLAVVGSTLLFSADDGIHGREPWMLEAEQELLTGDIDADGDVDFDDFLLLASNFGKENATRAGGDLNQDGLVDFDDFLLLAANFGAKRFP